MKRILIFSLAYYPSHVSGAEAAIKEITDRVTDIEFHLITLLFDRQASRCERVGNVTVHRVGFGGIYLSKILFVPLAALTARALHHQQRFDALWCMMTYMLFPLVLARILGVSAPHILTLQDGDPYEKVFERWFVFPFTPLLDYGFKTAQVIQVISSYLGTWPKRRGYRGEVVQVPNGANPKDIRGDVDPTVVEKIKHTYGKKAGDVWLVNTARLVHQKAYDDTIRALSHLPHNVKLLVVGEGPEEVALKSLAHQTGVSERVFFVGHVERAEVTAYRRAADIFVGPSRSEGLGNAFLSAMASGLPVIATREGGLAEFVFSGKEAGHLQTAWVVEKDSPESIAARVQDILASPQSVEEVTARARAMVREMYDWDKVAVLMKTRVFEKSFIS